MGEAGGKGTRVENRMAEDLRELLEKHFGFSDFRPGQLEVLENLEGGRDVLAIMPTGTGKSLCYQLYALRGEGVSLVVSPLIALMKDQIDQLQALGYPASHVNSTLSFDEQRRRLAGLRAGRTRLLYVTPERFRSSVFQQALDGLPVRLFAVDEAHCISAWGHDFRPDYLRLREHVERLGRPRILALTATATPQVRRDIVRQLGMQEPAVLVAGFDRPNLFLEAATAASQQEKMEMIAAVHERRPGSMIVYAATRKHVEKIVGEVSRLGLAAQAYHAGLAPSQRSRVQEGFMNGEVPIIVATNAFGMGVDKRDIRAVVHFDFPGTLEAYYQEIGRAGRDGEPSACVLLFNYADRRWQEFFIEGSHPSPDLIRRVYRFLESQGETVRLPTRSLAQAVGEKNEFAIHTCLVTLEKAGYIDRLNSYENRARIELNRDVLATLPDLPPVPLRVLEALLVMADSDEGPERGAVGVSLQNLARSARVDQEQLGRALALLRGRGLLSYEPPFRGRALRVLKPGRRELKDINFEEIARHKRFELQNLERVIRYASPFGKYCLRGFLLKYFGEWRELRSCGNCSRCEPSESVLSSRPAARRLSAAALERPAGPRSLHSASAPDPRNGTGKASLPEDDLTVALKILSCVCRCENQFGRLKIARILRGSASQEIRHMRRHRTYGLLGSLTEKSILDCLDRLIRQGYLQDSGGRFPTLRMTPRGIEFLKTRPAGFRFQ